MSKQEADIIRVIDTFERIGHRLYLVGLASEALEDDVIKHAFAGAIGDLQGFVRDGLEALRDLLEVQRWRLETPWKWPNGDSTA